MSHKIKVETACIKCGTPTLVFFSHKDDAKCRECLANELAKKHQQDGMKKAIKDAATYVEDIEFEFDKPESKLTAVTAQGEVFAAYGGVELMITEFGENAFDAIKKMLILQTLPKALKQLQFKSDFEKMIIDKYSMPILDFKKIYSLTKDDKANFKKLEQKIIDIIKSSKTKRLDIIIELADDKQEVRIGDPGTGVEHPRHICAKPFISLKTGEDHFQSTGKFGRGMQVFREFCESMEFYTLRNSPSDLELQKIRENNIDLKKQNVDPNYIHLVFPHDYPGGKYAFDSTKKYKKLSNHSGTGTVVILSKWKQRYYEDLSKHVSKLETRLAHHFGFGLCDIFNIGLKLKTKNKVIDIKAKDLEALLQDSDSKIQGRFNLGNNNIMKLKDSLGNPCGEIEFHLYKTNRNYHDANKEPFLVINGRPLGDTAIHQIPGLSQVADIWKANTITGYVIANDNVEPNQMRVGLANNHARQPFIDLMVAASIELRKQNTQWKNQMIEAQDSVLTEDIVRDVSKLLTKKGLTFGFKNPLQKGGGQSSQQNSGEKNSDDRVSNIPGQDTEFTDAKDGDEVKVGYKKSKTKQPGTEKWNNPIIVSTGKNKKDGKSITTTKVKRAMVQRKQSRKIKRDETFPDLGFNDDEECGNELSYFDTAPPTVMIQKHAPKYKKLVKQSRDQTNGDKYQKEKKKYLLARYLWEVLNHKAVQAKDEVLSDKERKDRFWTYYYELMDANS